MMCRQTMEGVLLNSLLSVGKVKQVEKSENTPLN